MNAEQNEGELRSGEVAVELPAPLMPVCIS
jgi:hypothetical protein